MASWSDGGTLTLTVATGLTPAAGAQVARVQAIGGDVRYRLDGTNPSAVTGLVLYAGETLDIHHANVLANANFIEAPVGAGSRLHVAYVSSE